MSIFDENEHREAFWETVRQAIEAGMADSRAGRTTDVKDVRARFGLPQ